MVLPNSALVRAGDAAGLRMVSEVFADRAYEDDASLVSRSKPGAVLHDAKAIAARVVRMVQDRAIVAASGKIIKVPVDTVCIHGDTPGAVDIARSIRQALQEQNIDVPRTFMATSGAKKNRCRSIGDYFLRLGDPESTSSLTSK